jgi:hypothetical protein
VGISSTEIFPSRTKTVENKVTFPLDLKYGKPVTTYVAYWETQRFTRRTAVPNFIQICPETWRIVEYIFVTPITTAWLSLNQFYTKRTLDEQSSLEKLPCGIFLKILKIVLQLIFRARSNGWGPFLHPEERQKVKHISYLITILHTSYGFIDDGAILHEGSRNVTICMHAVAKACLVADIEGGTQAEGVWE